MVQSRMAVQETEHTSERATWKNIFTEELTSDRDFGKKKLEGQELGWGEQTVSRRNLRLGRKKLKVLCYPGIT